MKEFERSRRVLDIVINRFKGRSPILIWLKLFFAHLDGNSEQVKAGIDELQVVYTDGNSGRPAWFIALYHIAINNDNDQAFAWLEKSYQRKEVELTCLQQEPLLEPFRNDDRYWSLHRKMGFDLVRSK
jgi:hypothetical protein